MDIPVGLMMTAVALYQEAETPLGEVGFFRPEGPTGPEDVPSRADEARDNVIAGIRQTFEEFEGEYKGRLPEERGQTYRALRQLAQWFTQGRFAEEQGDQSYG